MSKPIGSLNPTRFGHIYRLCCGDQVVSTDPDPMQYQLMMQGVCDSYAATPEYRQLDRVQPQENFCPAFLTMWQDALHLVTANDAIRVMFKGFQMIGNKPVTQRLLPFINQESLPPDLGQSSYEQFSDVPALQRELALAQVMDQHRSYQIDGELDISDRS